MAVTFQTDLRDIKDYGYVQQIPMEALFKNLGYKQAQYNDGARKMKALVDTLAVKAYGQDVEKRNEILNQVNEELAKFQSADLGRPEVQAELTNFISKVASSKDFTGIAARTIAYEKLLEKKEKLTKDGKGYISPWNLQPLTDAEDYFAGNQPYNPNKRFSGDLQVDTDFSSVDKAIADATPELKQTYKDGRYIKVDQGKAESQLYNNRAAYYKNNPHLVAEKRREFDYKTKDIPFEAQQRLSLEKALNVTDLAINNYRALLEAERRKSMPNVKLLNDYEAQLNHYETQRKFIDAEYNGLTPEKARAAEFETWLDDDHKQFATIQATFATREIKPDDFEKIAFETGQNLSAELKKIEAQRDKEIAVAAAKGQAKGGYSDNAATAALDVWNQIMGGESAQPAFDTPSEVEVPYFFNTKKEEGDAWTPEDFATGMDITTGIKGEWVPIQLIPTIVDLFGTPQTVTTDENGNTVRTQGKSIVAAFRSKTPGQLLVIQKDGDTHVPQVISTSAFRDAVIQRLSGTNFEKNKEIIGSKRLTGDGPASGKPSGQENEALGNLPAVTDSSEAADQQRRAALLRIKK